MTKTILLTAAAGLLLGAVSVNAGEVQLNNAAQNNHPAAQSTVQQRPAPQPTQQTPAPVAQQNTVQQTPVAQQRPAPQPAQQAPVVQQRPSQQPVQAPVQQSSHYNNQQSISLSVR